MSSKTMLKTCLAILVGVIVPLQAYGWGRYPGGFHPGYDPHFHRDPVIVHNTYVTHGGGGCMGCGVGAAAVAGLVGGVIVGAALAGSAPPPQTVVVQAPPQTVIVAAPAYGSQVPALPMGCNNMNVNGTTYYQCGTLWYQPFMGGNGVYYTIVPPP